MDISTLLPILLALGLLIVPELRSGNNSCGYTESSCNTVRPACSGCNPPVCPDNAPVGCENGGPAIVKRCNEGNVDISGVRFRRSPEEYCPCRLQELQDLADNGYETWRLDPVSVAARFMQNCFIDECFRGYPAYLAGKCRTCDKMYVVLGVGCAGKMIFELCQPVKQGECGIWIVTRYGNYNKCC